MVHTYTTFTSLFITTFFIIVRPPCRAPSSYWIEQKKIMKCITVVTNFLVFCVCEVREVFPGKVPVYFSTHYGSTCAVNVQCSLDKMYVYIYMCLTYFLCMGVSLHVGCAPFS